MIRNFHLRANLSITSRKNPNLMKSEKRTFASISLSTEKRSDKVMLMKEIDVIYNYDWQERGITPWEKYKLLTNILKEQTPIFEKIIYSKYNIQELPDSVLNRIMMNYDDGCCGADMVEEGNVYKWIHVFETTYPVNSLLLKAVANILILKHVRHVEIPQYMPNKIAHVRRHHYNFLKGLQNVESLIIVRFKSGQFDKSRMIANLPDVCSGEGLIANICRDYINLPVYDSMAQNSLSCPSAPPLGNITSCLNHIIYQDFIDKRLEERFPGIIYSRWLDELVIVNEMNSNKPKIDTEAIDNLLNELNISGSSDDLHAADDCGRGSTSNEFLVGKDENIILALQQNGCLYVAKYLREYYENDDENF